METTDRTEYGNQRSEQKKRKVNWRLVSIGGATGVLLGGAAAAIAAIKKKVADDGTSSVLTTDDGLSILPTSEGKTFGQAFSEAREKLGAGGVFEWRGKLYNTYTSDEWKKMSEQDKNAFTQKVEPHIEKPAQPEEGVGNTNTGGNHEEQTGSNSEEQTGGNSEEQTDGESEKETDPINQPQADPEDNNSNSTDSGNGDNAEGNKDETNQIGDQQNTEDIAKEDPQKNTEDFTNEETQEETEEIEDEKNNGTDNNIGGENTHGETEEIKETPNELPEDYINALGDAPELTEDEVRMMDEMENATNDIVCSENDVALGMEDYSA